MRDHVEFGWLEVITTHQFLKGVYRSRRTIQQMSEKNIPKFTSKDHMFAYQAFADACKLNDLVDVDYLKIKELIATIDYKGIWHFKYKIKTGWFFSEWYEMSYDEDWEQKLKEKDKKKKEEEKRYKPRYRRRRY